MAVAKNMTVDSSMSLSFRKKHLEVLFDFFNVPLLFFYSNPTPRLVNTVCFKTSYSFSYQLALFNNMILTLIAVVF